MTNRDYAQFREYCEIVERVKSAHNEDAFIAFIRFCSERLKRGDQVQAIWRDYQAIME